MNSFRQGPSDVSWATHRYMDVSDLNAKWDQALPAVAGLGAFGDVGTLSGNSLGVTGPNPFFGGQYPVLLWGQQSDDTLALQKATNDALKANGYLPIAETGRLDAPTCGALRTMCGLVTPSCIPPETCQEYTNPRRASGGGTLHAGMTGGGKNWVLIGAGVGLAAIGAALMFKKGRR